MQLAKRIAKFASQKKAEDIVILDMRGMVNFCDYFVICSGDSQRQLHAIADSVHEGLAEEGQEIRHQEGLAKSSRSFGAQSGDGSGAWGILDLGDVIVHIFEPKAREFYELEYLWQDAPKVSWKSK